MFFVLKMWKLDNSLLVIPFAKTSITIIISYAQGLFLALDFGVNLIPYC